MKSVGMLSAGLLLCAASAVASTASAVAQSPDPGPGQAMGDALPVPLTGTPGDPVRGRAIVANRQVGLCLLCHTAPIPEERFQGNLAPDLAGTGARRSEGQLRLRMVDSRRVNSESIMPAYHRTSALQRVGAAWQDKPILAPQQIEDVVAYLVTLR